MSYEFFGTRIWLLGLIFTSFLLTGCEQVVGEEEFPYEMKLVIRGLLEDGQDIKDIYIGRTLPVAVPFRGDFANLTNAVVSIKVDTLRYILRHTRDGLYSAPNGVKARAGKTYELLVSWENLSAGAVTKIPEAGTIGGVFLLNSVNDTGKSIKVMSADITPRGDEAYAVTWLAFTQTGQIYTEDNKYNVVAKMLPNVNTTTIQAQSAEITPSYLARPQDLGVGIYVYDGSFYDYYKTKGSSKLSDAVFGQPSTSVRWNILGDGIGMFVGRSKTTKQISSLQ
ncbi:MAG: DUF4249 domain-containing protein [Bacteroidetes bacterium]|nr:DUF4249 domain-containing protein [Bacteroidota bacterium]